jgi:DNA-binding NtrC family response regulator
MKYGAFDYVLKPFSIPQMKGLIEKALRAEKDGLKGTAYIDSGRDKSSMTVPIVEQFDKSLHRLAELIKERTKLLMSFPAVSSITFSILTLFGR